MHGGMVRHGELHESCPIHPDGHRHTDLGVTLSYVVDGANQTGEWLLCQRFRSNIFARRRLQIGDVIKVTGVHTVQSFDPRCTAEPQLFAVRRIHEVFPRVRLDLYPPIIPAGLCRTVTESPANGAHVVLFPPPKGL